MSCGDGGMCKVRVSHGTYAGYICCGRVDHIDNPDTKEHFITFGDGRIVYFAVETVQQLMWTKEENK